MPKPVQRSNLSSQVFDQLRDDILNKTFEPGQRLPSERELCEMLEVNRSSVREALKRLEQARLIDIRHGNGSVVLDFKLHGGFELLPQLLTSQGQINRVAMRSILEFRSLISPEIARLAARRIEAPELAELDRLVDLIEACPEGSPDELQLHDFEFHQILARASENLALLFIHNSVREIYLQVRGIFAVMFDYHPDKKALYRQILQAAKAHDEQTAAALCSELIEDGNQRFSLWYRQMTPDGDPTAEV